MHMVASYKSIILEELPAKMIANIWLLLGTRLELVRVDVVNAVDLRSLM